MRGEIDDILFETAEERGIKLSLLIYRLGLEELLAYVALLLERLDASE